MDEKFDSIWSLNVDHPCIIICLEVIPLNVSDVCEGIGKFPISVAVGPLLVYYQKSRLDLMYFVYCSATFFMPVYVFTRFRLLVQQGLKFL